MTLSPSDSEPAGSVGPYRSGVGSGSSTSGREGSDGCPVACGGPGKGMR